MQESGYKKDLNRITAPHLASRGEIFSVNELSDEKVWKGQSSWAEYEIKGKLDQSHRDVHDALLTAHEGRIRMNDAGQIELLVNPYEVRKSLNFGLNNEQIKKKITDLITCLVVIKAPNLEIGSNIVSERVAFIAKEDNEKFTLSGAVERINQLRKSKNPIDEAFSEVQEDGHVYWHITFSKGWSSLLLDTNTYYYGDKLKFVRDLRYSLTKAIARFMMTHKKGAHYEINKVIDIVAGESSSGNKRTSKSRMLKDEREILLLQQCGIGVVDGNFVKLF